MISLYFNIQHQKDSNMDHHGLGGGGGAEGIAATYARELQLHNGNNVSLINGGIVAGATTELEMGKLGGGGSSSKRSSRKSGSSSRRKKVSSGGGGGYARVSGDGDEEGGGGAVGVYGMDSEEEVDLGQVSRHRRFFCDGGGKVLFGWEAETILGGARGGSFL